MLTFGMFVKKTVVAGVLAGLVGSVALAGQSDEIKLAYVEWSTEIASTHVVRAVLEEAGYTVKLLSLSAVTMFQAVASGEADAMVAAWLPSTHGTYYNTFAEKLDDLGPNLYGTKLGLAVPSYTYSKVNSIGDIKSHAAWFGAQITGIDPGAGIMAKAEQAISEYALDGIHLHSGSAAIMTAALNVALSNNEDIVVTAWTPHWLFARYDLRYLDDPKGVFGGEEAIHTVVRRGLKADMPRAYAILDRFEWTPHEMNEVMLMNQSIGADPYVNAKTWVAEHPERVQAWLGN